MSDSMLDPIAPEASGLDDPAEGLAIDPRWPPSPATLDALAAAGIGDRRAAARFGVHAATFRAWRRRHRVGAPGRAAAAPITDSAAYGFDPEARWPAACRFQDDPRAVRAGRGRLTRPMTVVESACSLALLVP